ncbi:MAG: hypothetical protein ACXVX8_07155, partial [Blastococcus sp.]
RRLGGGTPSGAGAGTHSLGFSRGGVTKRLLLAPSHARTRVLADGGGPFRAGETMALPDPQSAPLDDDRRSRDRSLIARIAAAERWARTPDRTAATAPGRRGLLAKFERQADPDGILDADERTRRAQALMTAHMLRLARESAKARRRAR